jgi:hypothetical protein
MLKSSAVHGPHLHIHLSRTDRASSDGFEFAHDYPPVGQVFLFALLAALNPTLVAASTLMMLLPSPKRLMFGYLLGALMTSVTLGLVFSLEGSETVETTENALAAALSGGRSSVPIGDPVQPLLVQPQRCGDCCASPSPLADRALGSRSRLPQSKQRYASNRREAQRPARRLEKEG